MKRPKIRTTVLLGFILNLLVLGKMMTLPPDQFVEGLYGLASVIGATGVLYVGSRAGTAFVTASGDKSISIDNRKKEESPTYIGPGTVREYK